MKHKSDLIILTVIIGFLFWLCLGSFPFITPDGARYAEIPREMLARHQYLTPYLNGVKYFEKPPLFYWLQCFTITLFGLSEWSMRSMNAFMALLSCLTVYIGGKKLFDRRTGFIAALVLATCGLYFVMAHLTILDMPFTTFLTAALLSFIVGTKSPPGKKRNIYMWSMYICAALAVMTKGLIGIIFPGMIIGLWVLLFNKWRDLKTYCLPTGIILFLLIAAPWHILMQLKHPEFFQLYFIKQHFMRYLTNTAGRTQHLWFLPLAFIGGALPWVVFLIPALRHKFKSHVSIFLMLWMASIFVFYAFSQSQLGNYLLPMFPAFALLIGSYLAKRWRLRTFVIVFVVTAIVFVAGFYLFTKHMESRSVKPFTNKLQTLLKPGDEVASYDQYYQDLPFYLRRRITVVDSPGELAPGMKYQDTSAWMIDYPTFWRRWNSNNRMFVIMDVRHYRYLIKQHKNLYFMNRNGENVLVTNQKTSSRYQTNS